MKVKLLKKLRKNYSIHKMPPSNSMGYNTEYFRLCHNGKSVRYGHSVDYKELLLTLAYVSMPYSYNGNWYTLSKVFRKNVFNVIYEKIMEKRRKRETARLFKNSSKGEKVWYNGVKNDNNSI